MIIVGGIEFEQPTDKAIVTYDGGKYILLSSGNVIQRMLVSQIPAVVHDHAGQLLYPSAIRPGVSNQVTLGLGTPIIVIDKGNNTLNINVGAQCYVGGGRWNFTCATSGTAAAFGPTTPGYGIVYAGGYYLWPCSARLKTDIVKIPHAISTIEKAQGSTWKQDGVEGAGITAEDLEKLGLPNLTKKDIFGEYEAINPLGILPLLVEGIKELSARVAALEGVKK